MLHDLIGWLHERQLEQVLNRRIIDAYEATLVENGGQDPGRLENLRPRSLSSTCPGSPG